MFTQIITIFTFIGDMFKSFGDLFRGIFAFGKDIKENGFATE